MIAQKHEGREPLLAPFKYVPETIETEPGAL